MSGAGFDLIDEPWLPCLVRDGSVRKLGLRVALVNAHDLVELCGDPPVTAALSRLLLATVHRILDGPKTVADWSTVWAAGRFDEVAIDAYFEAWRERFDLFHPDYPFFQAPLSGTAQKSPTLLDPSAASGNNPTLFDHSLDDDPVPIAAEEAARRLVTLQAFSAGGLMSGEGGGRVSGMAAPLSGSWVFLVTGPSLFHTLLANTVRYDPDSELPFATTSPDMPAWERPPSADAVERNPAGWLDLLTYPSRRVCLGPPAHSDTTPVVSAVSVTDGDRPNKSWTARGREQALAFQQRTRGWAPFRPREDRDLWRDADVLWAAKSSAEPPPVIEHVARLVRAGAIETDTRLGLSAFALATYQAKYLFWRHRRLPLPARLFQSDVAGERIAHAVTSADKVARALQRAVAELAGRPEQAKLDSAERKRRRTWAEHAMSEFWSRLTPSFDRFLVDLAAGAPAMPGWAIRLEEAVRAVWMPWSLSLLGSPSELRRAATADVHFGKAIRIARQLEHAA